jgi:hypothetical protein
MQSEFLIRLPQTSKKLGSLRGRATRILRDPTQRCQTHGIGATGRVLHLKRTVR